MKPENLHKLVTKEDPDHIHKTLGFVSLGNFVYRYVALVVYGSMYLNNVFSMTLLGVHALLSLTSLRFHISSFRNPSQPMIYPEFRMHSILFAIRSIVCCYMATHDYAITYKIAVCYATMGLADIVTYVYKTKVSVTATSAKTSINTTMRGMPYDPSITAKQQHDITRFQSAMQISATLFMLGNTDTAFSPLLAIQLAAFLMTLVRKNIINANMWHLIYNLTLCINVFCYKTVPVQWMTLQIVMFYLFKQMRFSWNFNKYVAWSVVFFLFYMHETYLIESPFDTLIKYYDLDTIYQNTVIAWFMLSQVPRMYALVVPLVTPLAVPLVAPVNIFSYKFMDHCMTMMAKCFVGMREEFTFDGAENTIVQEQNYETKEDHDIR